MRTDSHRIFAWFVHPQPRLWGQGHANESDDDDGAAWLELTITQRSTFVIVKLTQEVRHVIQLRNCCADVNADVLVNGLVWLHLCLPDSLGHWLRVCVLPFLTSTAGLEYLGR